MECAEAILEQFPSVFWNFASVLRRQFVLDHLAEYPLIRNADLCDGLGISPATANRILRELNEDGTLERVRDGKFWAYRLAGKA